MPRRHTKQDVWSDLESTDKRVAALERAVSMGLAPTGTVWMWAGPQPPFGCLVLDGSSYRRSEYSLLFEVLGGESSPWGLPDAEHFNVPDMRDCAPVGVSGTIDLAWSGGEKTHVLTAAEMPAHTHTVPGSVIGGTGVVRTTITSGSPQATTSSAGGGGAHNNMQPSIGLYFIIKT